MKRYIIELDGCAVKEYKKKGYAMEYARNLAKLHLCDEYVPVIVLHEFEGRKGSILWTNYED